MQISEAQHIKLSITNITYETNGTFKNRVVRNTTQAMNRLPNIHIHYENIQQPSPENGSLLVHYDKIHVPLNITI